MTHRFDEDPPRFAVETRLTETDALREALAAEDAFMDYLERAGWHLDNGKLRSVWDAARQFLRLMETGEKVWYCRDAFGNRRLLDEPCGGADSAEGCGWMLMIPTEAP